MQAVEGAQKRENDTLKAIQRSCTEHKRELLALLSGWLLTQAPTTAVLSEWPEMERLSAHSLEEWMNLQRAAEDFERQLATSKRLEQQARKNYDGSAPLGRVSGWFVQGPPKAHIETLASTVQRATSTREQIEKHLARNVSERQAWAERFLRACLSNLNQLAGSQVLGSAVTHILSNLCHQTSWQWEAHAATERATLAELAAQVEALQRLYSD